MNKTVFVCLCSILVVVCIICGYCVFKELYDRKKDIDDFNKIKEITMLEGVNLTDDTNKQESPTEKKKNLSELMAMNSDCIGWIAISDTSVDYPVMHTPNNSEYYLRRNFYKQYSQSGVPFLDVRCTQNDTNLIVYGHNMINGTMFSALTSYTNKSFWQKHRFIEFQTSDYQRTFEVFAVLITDVSDRLYGFLCVSSETEYDDMIQYAKKKSVYDTKILPRFGDRLLTLSTCYGSAQSGRILILAKEI